MNHAKEIVVGYENIQNYIDSNRTVYIFNKEDIEKIDYYLTPPSYDSYNVKLGAKCTLKNGEIYGNVIQIPFNKLKELVKLHE